MTNDIYVLHIWKDVEPRLFGPYETHKKRDEALAQLVVDKDITLSDDSVFTLIVTNGKPSIHPFSAGDIDAIEKAAGV